MRRFARIMVLADIRSWMFFFVIQVLTLWNVHVLWLLERWQRDAGAHVTDWLAALGETEALMALATLAHDNPTWSFPEVAEGQPLLAAQSLGHPLLPDALRVCNDVSVGPAGRFLLVTGSNMSGKSTLLRAIGVNVSLAQAGGPVCAQALRLPPIELATSMRVQDSLEQGISSFMAELRRLKSVVETAERVRAEGEFTLLFLLDEILHGTNTAERQIAARRVIRHLLACGATGAVSTHDLALADDPALASTSQPVYFTETFEPGPDGPVMRFDYRLRPGIAPSTNALALVRQILGPAVADED
jgi:DNA mismatch repair ATPase MutS